jgi:uncharacterized protein YrzB (UPF0473 family)
MKFLFLVGSSLKHFQENKFSAYDEEERFNQTLATIENIREKVPNSYVLLFECSSRQIEEKQRDIFKEKADLFLEFYKESVLQQIYENLEQRPELITYGKSLLETRGLLNTLYQIKKHNLFNDSQRIFKLTGRYLLNDDFNIQDYQSKILEGYYVIKKYDYLSMEESELNQETLENVYAYLYGAKGMMVTGLWSFDRLLFNETIKYLEQSFFYMEKMIQFTAGTDIEHSLYRFIDKTRIISIPNLGLTVIKGMSGENGGTYFI